VQQRRFGGFIGREAEANESASTPVIHHALESLEPFVALSNRFGHPCPCREYHERVEDLLVQARRGREGRVPTLDRETESSKERRIDPHVVRDVRDSERNVTRLISEGEVGYGLSAE
jgi:hypothetical protein